MTKTQSTDDYPELSVYFDDEAEDDDVDPRRRRRRIIVALVTVLVVLGLVAGAVGTYLHLVLDATADAPTVTTQTPTVAAGAPASFALPPFGASALSVTGAEDFAGTVGTNGILTSSGSVDAAAIASISKLITALVILDAKPLSDTDDGPAITFTEADADLYDAYYVRNATIQPMRAGSTLTERQALEVILIGSASNYAEAVSTWAFGSQAGFVRAANRWLDANGLTSTTFVEPTGLDARNRSTPAELIALGRIAQADPVVATIVNTRGLDVPGVGYITNSNDLLGVDGVIGLKTGTSDAAGSCLLFSALADNGTGVAMHVVGVVLGSDDRQAVDNSVVALLDSLKAGFHPIQVVERDQVFGTVTTAWGDAANIVASQDATLITWSDTPVTVSMTMDEVGFAAEGAQVGTVTYTAENQTTTIALLLDAEIAGPDDQWRITHPRELLDW